LNHPSGSRSEPAASEWEEGAGEWIYNNYREDQNKLIMAGTSNKLSLKQVPVSLILSNFG
jgi:hypothetical protein